METSLHRQLKEVYAAEGAECEVPLGSYRIDVVNPGELVEIQHGSLAAIRDKIARLLTGHDVLVVKPIVARKRLVKLARRGGRVLERRWSPKRGTPLDLFDELVYFTRVFPHRRLRIEAPLVEIEEWRYPGHGRRRRRRENDFRVEDQKLVSIDRTLKLRTRADLVALAPAQLDSPFHTGQLAEQLAAPRSVAQRIAYCWREMGAARVVGKKGNALLYKLTGRRRRAKAA